MIPFGVRKTCNTCTDSLLPNVKLPVSVGWPPPSGNKTVSLNCTSNVAMGAEEEEELFVSTFSPLAFFAGGLASAVGAGVGTQDNTTPPPVRKKAPPGR